MTDRSEIKKLISEVKKLICSNTGSTEEKIAKLIFNGSKPSKEFLSDLAQALRLSAKKSDERFFFEKKAEINLLIRNLSFEDFPFHTWLKLFYVLCHFGYLEAGGLCRIAATEKFIVSSNGAIFTPRIWAKRKTAEFESGIIHRTVPIIEYFSFLSRRNKEIQALSDILRKNRSSVPSSFFQNRENKNFAHLLEKKKIALIGPGQTKFFSMAERYDIHVYLNNIPVEKLKEENASLLSTPIVIYANKSYCKALLEGDQSLAVCPRYLRAKSSKYNLHKSQYSSNVPFSVIDLLPPFFQGSPHLAQIAIFDLLRFSPASISIFGVDLYLGSGVYRSDYWQGEGGLEKRRLYQKETCITHDFVANYKFLYNISKQELLTAEDDLSRIMDLGIHSYLESMDFKYGYPNYNT